MDNRLYCDVVLEGHFASMLKPKNDDCHPLWFLTHLGKDNNQSLSSLLQNTSEDLMLLTSRLCAILFQLSKSTNNPHADKTVVDKKISHRRRRRQEGNWSFSWEQGQRNMFSYWEFPKGEKVRWLDQLWNNESTRNRHTANLLNFGPPKILED